jgi:DNA-binding XRE family transcriptional regulator
MPDVASSRGSTRLSPSITQIRQGLGVSRERLARLLDVSTKTIERWEARASPPKNRRALARLVKLGEIVELGHQVYTPEAFHSFISLPMPVFGGRTALQMIEMDEIDRVYGEIVADYEGAGY